MVDFSKYRSASHKLAVYVPGTCGENVRDNSDYIQRVKRALCCMFGGCTTVRGEGSWVDDSGNVIDEITTIVYAFTNSDALQENGENILDICRMLRDELQQSCVGFEIDTDFYLLGAEE